MYSLDQLRGFVAVAEELHFGRAAERLNMTQPPLSRQIQKLERAIAVQLFERDNRGVELTPAGKAFLVEARRLLALAESAPTLARRISAGAAGTVRIGFTAASTYGVLGNILNRLAEELPDIEVDLHEMVTRDQLAALNEGEIDLGLARPPVDAEAFDSMVLHREPLVVALPSGHRLLSINRRITSEDLHREKLIMHSPLEARYFYDLVIRLVPITNTHFVHVVSQILTMVSLVAAGRGIAVVPASAKVLGIDGVEFARLDLALPDPVELRAIWRRDARNPALARLLNTLRAEEVRSPLHARRVSSHTK